MRRILRGLWLTLVAVRHILVGLAIAGAIPLAGGALWVLSIVLAPRPGEIFSDRISEVMIDQGTNPAELALIVEHQVDRVCFVHHGIGIGDPPLVRDAADHWGIAVDERKDAEIIVYGYALYIVAPGGTATYGQFPYRVFRMPSDGAHCWAGGRLALRFDSVDPLAGGRLIDLDSPDLKPRRLD